MGSDVYESYIVTMLASLLIAVIVTLPNLFIWNENIKDVMKPLNRSFYISAAIAIGLNFAFTKLFKTYAA